MTEEEIVARLGPLAPLAGTWEGDEGVDESPSSTRGRMETRFRERIIFEPMGPVDNHEQQLFALRYFRVAFRINESEPFHEDQGYWLWDAARGQVMRGFVVPRGVTILAGGDAAESDRGFSLSAQVGAQVYGISSNPFLEEEFKTVRYELEVAILSPTEFRYAEDTQLLLKGHSEPFHHRDLNRLQRID